MPAFKDLTGQTFGRITALRCVGRDKHGNAIWLGRCSCSGKEIEVAGSSLASGNTTSCGCARADDLMGRIFSRLTVIGRAEKSKHGAMRWVCLCSCGAPVPILCCDRWLNSFEAFLEDMGERPEGKTLGRFGDVGHYEKSNCAWQTKREQVAEQKLKRQLKLAA